MSGPTVVVLVASLTAVLLVVLALMLWQESRRGKFETVPTYVIDDAVRHIARRLPAETLDRLGIDGVERMIEWEVRYLQGGPGVRSDRSPVAGGHRAAVEFIADRIAEVHDVAYAPEDIGAVLALEADYLATIGAIGSEVADGGAGS